MINELTLRIKGRKDDLPVEGGKIWEQKELITIKKSLELIEEHQQIADEYANNLKYVFSQIKPQFIAMDVRVAENKRIKLRQKEYKRQKKRRQEKAAKKQRTDDA